MKRSFRFSRICRRWFAIVSLAVALPVNAEPFAYIANLFSNDVSVFDTACPYRILMQPWKDNNGGAPERLETR